MLKLPRHR